MKRKPLFAQNAIGAAVAAMLLITTLPSFADDAKTPSCKERHHAKHGGFPINTQARLDKLKTALKIQPSQEGAWQAFASTVEGQQTKMKARHEQAKSHSTLSLPDRLDRHLAFMKEREVDMEEMNTALKNLYSSLTPDQRAMMDKHFSHHGQHRGAPQVHQQG